MPKPKLIYLDKPQYLASGDLAGALESGFLAGADLPYTFFFRYVRLCTTDLHTMHGEKVASNGPTMDYVKDRSWLAYLTSIGLFLYSIINFRHAYKAKQIDSERNSQRVVQPLVQKQLSSKKPLSPEEEEAALKKYNDILKSALEKDKDLREKYASIQIVKEKKKYAIQLQKRKSTSLSEHVKNIWDTGSNALGLTSYTYWILFIGVAVITGVWGFGISAAALLIPPLAVTMGLYLIPKIRNKLNGAQSDEEKDFYNLAKKIAMEKELAEAEEGLTQAEKPGNQTQKLVTQAVTGSSIAHAATTAVIGGYVAWQYNMWYATDALAATSAAAHAALALEVVCAAIGAGIFAIAVMGCMRAGYEAYTRYKKNKEIESKKSREEIAAEKTELAFLSARRSFSDYFKFYSTRILQNQKQNVQDLEVLLRKKERECCLVDVSDKVDTHDQLLNQMRQADAHSYTGKVKQELWNAKHLLDFGMTGAFVARTVVVGGTVSFLLPGLAAAVLLSNPWTIGVLVAAGVAWACYRYYNYRQASNVKKMKEANDRMDLIQKKMHILDCRLVKQKQQQMQDQDTAAIHGALSRSRSSCITEEQALRFGSVAAEGESASSAHVKFGSAPLPAPSPLARVVGESHILLRRNTLSGAFEQSRESSRSCSVSEETEKKRRAVSSSGGVFESLRTSPSCSVSEDPEKLAVSSLHSIALSN